MTTTFEAIAQPLDTPYRRVPTPDRRSVLDAFKQQDIFTLQDLNNTAPFSYGLPGVAIFDYDRDDDLCLRIRATASLSTLQLSVISVTPAITHHPPLWGISTATVCLTSSLLMPLTGQI